MGWSMTNSEKRFDKRASARFKKKYKLVGKKRKSKNPKHRKVVQIKEVEGAITHRNTKYYKAWRKLVFKKNGQICNRCGETEGILHAHHMKSYYKNPEERLSIANGEVLCFDCHDKIHKGYLRYLRAKAN